MKWNYRTVAVGIFFLALAVRLPFLSFPPSVVFDEGLYATFSYFVGHRVPHFDVHPPLARMIFGALGGEREMGIPRLHDVNGAFGNFPYIRIRTMNAILGSVLAVLVFYTSFLLFRNVFFAFLSALFIIFDNAFVLYSRLVLPDMLLWAFGLAGVIAYLRHKVSVSGILIGLATSVKWTGLGFGVIPVLFFFFERRWKNIAEFSIWVCAVYIAVFVGFFSLFSAERVEMYMFQKEPLRSIMFPDGSRASSILAFLPKYHTYMLEGHSLLHGHGRASTPVSWFAGGKQIVLWSPEGAHKKLILTGNFISWVLGLLAVLGIGFYGFLLVIRRTITLEVVSKGELLLLLGYFANLLPFFLVSRDLFLYHYMSALIFAYVLIPVAVERFTSFLGLTRYSGRIQFLVIMLSISVFIVLSPVTYGFRLPALLFSI